MCLAHGKQTLLNKTITYIFRKNCPKYRNISKTLGKPRYLRKDCVLIVYKFKISAQMTNVIVYTPYKKVKYLELKLKYDRR